MEKSWRSDGAPEPDGTIKVVNVFTVIPLHSSNSWIKGLHVCDVLSSTKRIWLKAEGVMFGRPCLIFVDFLVNPDVHQVFR